MGTFCVVSEGLDKLCIMGRMHSNGKGISGSSKPFKRTPPSWVKTNARTVTDKVVRLARKGNTPSTIGAILRDGEGIPDVRAVTAKKITRIEGQGSVPGSARGPVLLDQEGCGHEKASREEQQGPRPEVPPGSDRVAHLPSGPLLQARWQAAAHLEVREQQRLDSAGLSHAM